MTEFDIVLKSYSDDLGISCNTGASQYNTGASQYNTGASQYNTGASQYNIQLCLDVFELLYELRDICKLDLFHKNVFLRYLEITMPDILHINTTLHKSNVECKKWVTNAITTLNARIKYEIRAIYSERHAIISTINL